MNEDVGVLLFVLVLYIFFVVVPIVAYFNETLQEFVKLYLGPLIYLFSLENPAFSWIVTLISGGLLIVTSIILIRVSSSSTKYYYMFKIGALLTVLSIILLVVTTILPFSFKRTTEYKECGELIGENIDLVDFITCSFIGYKVSESVGLFSKLHLILAIIIMPFSFFVYTFLDVLNSINFITNRNARRVISFIGAYMALRGFLGNYLIDFFTFGWVGMGALYVSIFITAFLWALVGKFFTGVIESENMKKLLEVLSGRERKKYSLKDFLTFLAGISNPYDFINTNFAQIESSLISIYGAGGIAHKLRLILDKASSTRNPNQSTKDQIENLIRRL